jgi:hypothetical protein
MQLYAIGPQDAHITLDPEMQHFQRIYHRHVHCALEAVEHDFPQGLRFGELSRLTVPLEGDFLGEVYLQVTLPDLSLAEHSWCPQVGYAMLRSVRLVVDDIAIHEYDKYTLSTMDALLNTTGRNAARDVMIGATPLPMNAEHVLYVPLGFFHCRPQQGHGWLPLRALRNSTVRIEVDVEPASNLVHPRPAVMPAAIADAGLIHHTVLLQYAFIDRAAVPFHMDHRMLIEQVQRTDGRNFETASDFDVLVKPYAFIDIPFVNYVKSLVWTVQRQDSLLDSNYFGYIDAVATGSIYLDGTEVQAARGGGYYRLLQPYEHGRACPANIYSLHFALESGEHQPSGFSYMSAFSEKRMRLDFTPQAAGERLVVRAYAVSYNIFEAKDGVGSLAYAA